LTAEYSDDYAKCMGEQYQTLHLIYPSSLRAAVSYYGFFSIVLVFFFMFFSTANAGGSTSLKLSPSNLEVDTGKDITVAVHLNSGGQAVNAVQADISYPLNVFDPVRSSIKCANAFSTQAQSLVNSTIDIDGMHKGLAKVACAVTLGQEGATPFSGETDVATLSLHVRQNAPPVSSSKMLELVIDNNLADGHNNYSQVARASDSEDILGEVFPAAIAVKPLNNNFKKFDINNNSSIDSSDLVQLISSFSKKPSNVLYPKTDINGDHKINIIDLSILLSNLV
jgi:hypothetical protein